MGAIGEAERVTKPGLSVAALTALVAVVAIAVAAVVGWWALDGRGSDGAPPSEATSPDGIGATGEPSSGPREMIIWLDPQAVADEIAAIDGLLADHSAVISHRYVDREATYASFSRLFGDEQVIALVSEDEVPTSYEVEVEELSIEDFVAEFEAVTGVTDVVAVAEQPDVRPVLAGPSRYVVWLEVGVTDGGVAAIDQALAAHPLLLSSDYIDQDETYEDFKEYFADEPEILDLVEPDQLPTSFVVMLDLGDDETAAIERHLAFESDVEGLLGVDDVEGGVRYEPTG